MFVDSVSIIWNKQTLHSTTRWPSVKVFVQVLYVCRVAERSYNIAVCPIFIIWHISIACFVSGHCLGGFGFETSELKMLSFLLKIQPPTPQTYTHRPAAVPASWSQKKGGNRHVAWIPCQRGPACVLYTQPCGVGSRRLTCHHPFTRVSSH